MAENEAPAAKPNSTIGKVDAFVGKHKIVVFGGGALAFILLLSSRGKTATIAAPAVAATDETGVDTGDTGSDTGEGDEIDTPTTDTTTPDTPVDTTPPVALPPPDPGPTAPTPAMAAPPAPALAAPTIGSNPSLSTPAGGTPTTAAPAPIRYTTVPGYYTELQVIRTSGATETWHHYTSGTRAQQVVHVSDQGTAWGWPYKSTPGGWTKGGLSYIPNVAYYRVLSTVQYESTQVASTTAP